MYMNDGNKTKINLRNKSVFITGVAGFIGSNLAKRLLSTVEGVKVVGLDNMNHYYDVRLKEARLNELEQFDNFSFVKGNLADKAVIESIFEQYKPEIVVNLGAQAGVRYSITNPDAYVEANKQTLKFLDKIKPDIIILYEPNSILYVLKMLNLSKKEGFKLVIETTEWRNPKDYRGIIPRVINTEKDLQKKYIDKKVGNVIAISKYLYQHYLEQNCNTILLPPIFPEADKKKKLIRENSDNRKVLKIVYAGALASKDYIDTLLHAIIRLNTDEVRVVIDIIGPDKMQVQKLVGNDELEKYGIYCHGRLSHDKTLSIVEKADLSVLLRMNKRYAKAGVSTKFCEAMMLGVPSICTSVGGTDLFVKDKYNGFLVRNNDLNTLETTLLSIIDLSREQIEEIKNNALTTANELFTPDKYIEQFNAFLNKCK